MMNREPWLAVWQSLRENRVRTLLTLMGLTWGTFSIVVLLAFGMGLNHLLRHRADNLGRSLVVVWPQKTTLSYAGLGRGHSLYFRAKDILALPQQIPELDLISPEYVTWDRVEKGTSVHRAALCGVYPAYGELRSWNIQPGGRFLNQPDLVEHRRVVVLGNGIKAALFGPANAVGQAIVLKGIPFRVIGVMQPKDQDSDYNGRDEEHICLPATAFEQLFGFKYISDFVFRARDPKVQALVLTRLYQVLGNLYQFSAEDRLALSVWDTTEQERLLSYVFLGLNLMLGGSGALTLLVGGVGVGNLMFIRVRQRTHEIGIQMALGAKPRRILWGVLMESLVLVCLGGGLGFAFSWLVTIITRLTPVTAHIGEPRISWLIAGLTILLLGSVGLLAGYYPARRAARLDPVLALADLPS